LTSAEEIKTRVLAGDRRALSRTATLIESGAALGREILRLLLPHTGQSVTIGITGPPGAGKSTLATAMAASLRKEGKKVGILAVDPSSPLSRGAILGDRIRMQEHHADSGVFIRSMATRGGVGGVAAATADIALLLDSAGFDIVLIETVGVGQDEVDIAGMADVTIVILVPGFGDDVQAIKAGILEIADIFAVNKADLPGADRVEQELRTMQSFSEPDDEIKPVPVCRLVATERTGVDELVRLATDVAARKRGPGSVISTRNVPRSGIEIDHLGIAVRHLEEALGFYERQLGMALHGRETIGSEQVNVAMLPTGADAGSPRIELLEAIGSDSPIAKFIDKRGPGLHHVALKVDDLQATIERLKNGGALILNEPRRGAGGHLYVFIHPQSTGGVLIELIER
jgi:LAO/AO transport system kinase